MEAVKISDIKAHLSEYLRKVKSGKELEVLDRGTPVARLVPVISDLPVSIIPPKHHPEKLAKLKSPKTIQFNGEVMDILQEERAAR